MRQTVLYFTSLVVEIVMICAGGAAMRAASLHITADHAAVPEGGTLVVKCTLAPPKSRRTEHLTGIQLWPYLNGRQWGAPATTDGAGRAEMMIPLPLPGIARIQVAIAPPALHVLPADWIWSYKLASVQTVYFQRQFRISKRVQAAKMLMTCDNACTAWLNGHRIGSGSLWRVDHLHHLKRFLQPGENLLSVKGQNYGGPAGLLARLTIRSVVGAKKVIATDGKWRCFAAKPAGWPAAAGSLKLARRLMVIAPAGQGDWGDKIRGWPGINPGNQFPVGQPPPAQVVISNTVSIRVVAPKFTVPPRRRHLVGMIYEPWFTPENATWIRPEAIPLVGKYPSANPMVIRQHALWFDKMGINYVLIDWTCNVFGEIHWHQNPVPYAKLVNATTLIFKTYAKMRRQGIPTPQITLLVGLKNGGPTQETTTTALNGEMDWVYRKYVQNPHFTGLWLNYRHKPLILVMNGGGPAFLANKLASGEPPIHRRQFTVRYMGSQLQGFPAMVRAGYWSWMDGSIAPIPTFNRGQCEALTITPAFFAFGGWLAPTARARDNGFTYVREFKTALRYRPHFLTICQWNEFAGQPIDQGFGPKHNIYVDSYDASLSNDIEPTSLTARGYRGHRGWGYYYLNLTRACIELYHQKKLKTTLVAIGSPARNGLVKGGRFRVRWACIGRPPRSFTLLCDGKRIAGGIKNSVRAFSMKLSGLKPGRHVLTLLANGAMSLFNLSYRRESRRLSRPIPTAAKVTFFLR